MTAILNQIAEKWFSWEVSMFWQVGLLIVIVAGLDLLIKKWAWPQVRYALWLLILVKLVLPPTLTSPTSFTAEIPIVIKQTLTDTDYNTDKYGQKGMEQPLATAEMLNSKFEIRNSKQIQITKTEDSKPEQNFLQINWKVYIMFVWAGGMAILTGWLIIRLGNLRREHLKNKPQLSLPERLEGLLELTAKKIGLKKVPQVILTNKVCCPAVFGVFKPVLLMPADKLQNMTVQDAEHIFLHELAHIKRGDLFVHAVYMILQIAYWFNPLIWLIRKHLQNLRELCCDATVARMLREKTAGYRQTLLETARQLLAEPVDPGLGLLGLFENSSWLVDRLRWLEKKSWRYRPLRIATIFILVCLMSACVLPMTKYDAPVDFVIKGTVTDAQTGKPIAGAKVGDVERYAEGRFNTTTDANGNYSYKTWYEEHGVTASAAGYKEQRKTLLTKIFGREKEKVINFGLKATHSTSSGQAEIKQKPAGQEEQDKKQMSFGLVNECTIHQAVSEQSAIDFDTGTLHSSGDSETPEGFDNWLKTMGIDAVSMYTGVYGLCGFEMIVVPVEKEMWNTSPEQVIKFISGGEPGTPANISGKGELPATYFFKTREGGIGVLQITGFNENPKGVKIRYKMVENSAGRNENKTSEDLQKSTGQAEEPIKKPNILSKPPKAEPITLLGMQLIDVTPELQAEHRLYHPFGVLILDPGFGHQRLGIGELQKGYYFWMIGNKEIKNIREMITEILRINAKPKPTEGGFIDEGNKGYVRVVYGYGNGKGTNTQYLQFTEGDVKELRRAGRVLGIPDDKLYHSNDKEIETRIESAKKLSDLWNALFVYANDHTGEYPDDIGQLESYDRDGILKWAMENVGYLGQGKTITIGPQAVIAYDNTLLKKDEGTNILYNDSHVAFEKLQRLETLGIKPQPKTEAGKPVGQSEANK